MFQSRKPDVLFMTLICDKKNRKSNQIQAKEELVSTMTKKFRGMGVCLNVIGFRCSACVLHGFFLFNFHLYFFLG